MTRISTLFAISTLCLFVACSPQQKDLVIGDGSVDLKVAIRTGFNSIYLQDKYFTGPEYDLLKQFAQHADLSLHIRFAHTAQQAFSLLEKNKVDLIGGLLVLPPHESTKWASRLNYITTQNILIRHYRKSAPTRLADIRMRDIEVSDNPMHLETLKKLRRKNNDPTLWSLNKKIASYDLFHLVDNGVAEYAVADSREWDLASIDYPRIKKAFTLSENLPVGWVFQRKNTQLIKRIEAFEKFLRKTQELGAIVDRYYGDAKVLAYPEKIQFIQAYEKIIRNGYLQLFHNAANRYATDQHDIDWKLIAALSYQESLWNWRAQSPSGVKGIMMITQDIAKKFGVKSRFSAQENIDAGTQYFLSLRKRLQNEVAEPDRTWYALVAYNTGYHHLQKMIAVTKKKGLNPFLWVHLKTTLQEDSKYRKKRSKGQKYNIPVRYVYRVRAYYRLLSSLSNEGPKRITPTLKSFLPYTTPPPSL